MVVTRIKDDKVLETVQPITVSKVETPAAEPVKPVEVEAPATPVEAAPVKADKAAVKLAHEVAVSKAQQAQELVDKAAQLMAEVRKLASDAGQLVVEATQAAAAATAATGGKEKLVTMAEEATAAATTATAAVNKLVTGPAAPARATRTRTAAAPRPVAYNEDGTVKRGGVRPMGNDASVVDGWTLIRDFPTKDCQLVANEESGRRVYGMVCKTHTTVTQLSARAEYREMRRDGNWCAGKGCSNAKH
ncbi:hypothetical protein DBP12_03575 [Streptomyces sp. CS014]|nr:hypothetical protein DBP12_03575 [Streptomyces sp. CS014]